MRGIPHSTKYYVLTDDQAEWIEHLLLMASDPATGIIDTTSSGGYKGDTAVAVFAFLHDTAFSIGNQHSSGPGAALLVESDFL
jgi:hypothetical protein